VKLHHRIVIPFASVAVVAITATAYVALSVASRALESRVQSQIDNAAALVSQSEFALNPVILRSVKAIAGGDVLTFNRSGTILATTLDAEHQTAVTLAVMNPTVVAQAIATPPTQSYVTRLSCGAPCFVAFHRVPSRPDTLVAVISQTTELMAATRAVTGTIAVAAILSVAGMIIVSQLVARRVTAPLDRLVQFADATTISDATTRAAVGDDEVGRLGQAFNAMLERLAESRRALVRSEKLAVTGLIAARIAHDIRNPLSAIKMQTQLLQARLRRTEDEPMRDGVEAILRDVLQVETVIQELLELARPSELHRQPVRLNDIVREVLTQLGPQLKHRQIAVETRLEPSEPVLELDATRLKHGLLNVINNAADAMTAGGTLRIESAGDLARAAIRIDVCDDGEGIDPSVADRVFDPFVSTKREGVGLGLVNAKAAVESHGGRIELAPLSPRGTRATIWLPMVTPTHG